MTRVLITALLAAAIAGAVIYVLQSRDASIQKSQQQQISRLNDQVTTLKAQNDTLKSSLAEVQNEQQNLVLQNRALNKAIAQYMATGKMPKIPYPPK